MRQAEAVWICVLHIKVMYSPRTPSAPRGGGPVLERAAGASRTHSRVGGFWTYPRAPTAFAHSTFGCTVRSAHCG